MSAFVDFFPIRMSLPHLGGGSASTTAFSKPAQSSLTLRPARVAQPPNAAFVTRLQPDQLPGQAARQLPNSIDNCSGGFFLHWLVEPFHDALLNPGVDPECGSDILVGLQ